MTQEIQMNPQIGEPPPFRAPHTTMGLNHHHTPRRKNTATGAPVAYTFPSASLEFHHINSLGGAPKVMIPKKPQKEMVVQMISELEDHCIECPDIVGHSKGLLKSVEEGFLNDVMAKLLIRSKEESFKIPRKRPRQETENMFYNPVFSAFDCIFQTIYDCWHRSHPNSAPPPWLTLRVLTWTKDMNCPPGWESDQNPLRPDGVAILQAVYDEMIAQRPTKKVCDGTPHNTQLSESSFDMALDWRTIQIVFEIKGRWKELVSQAGTYARAIFAVKPECFFVVGILFNQQDKKLRVAIYNRAGVVLTKLIGFDPYFFFHEDSQSPKHQNLLNDLKGFVSILCSFMLQEDKRGLGMDPSRSNDHFLLPDIGIYKAKQTPVCNRRCVVGKGTFIQVIESSCKEYLATALKQNTLFDWKLSDNSNPPPSVLVYKKSHVYVQQPMETTVFENVQGHMGIPLIFAEYKTRDMDILICHGEEGMGEHRKLDFSRNTVLIHPLLKRELRIMLSVTVGKELVHLDGPKAVLDAVLDAICGGYLHRDISVGNVLKVQKTSCRKFPATQLFESSLASEIMTKMQANLGLNTDNWLPLLDQVSERDYMEGFIMDGDQAKPTSTSGARFPRSHISVCFISLIYLQTGVEKHGQGTKQFMSAHLLQQWGNDETSMKAIHTQLDDLESFLWVIIFIGLHSFHRVQRSLTAQEEKYLKNIEGSVDALANFKRLMLADIRKSDPAFMLDCPNIVCLTRYFPLREWAYLAETWCSEMRLLESFTTAEPESEDAKKLDDKLREIFLESKHHYAAWLLPGWLKREELSATITWRNA